ncbi:MAG: anthranilate phosphoribosyltransferase [Fimbriimonadaceae bacterium]|nr:anthranilate phosphoribosyltransferase [Fimbriimonadaceae bacterium]QYK57059.1 MAG: anthranilate phosphoribosyltransferase [Fimbriimonadaceae bacterium]
MALTHVLHRYLSRESLGQAEAAALMRTLVQEALAPEQVAALLALLQAKGATGEELAGMASVLREAALNLSVEEPALVDTCGTGGGRPSFNLSTGSAIVAAAAGAKVAKHGNRSVTSKCGSADVLEALGVSLSADSERLPHILRSTGIVFLFAPNHHPAMARLGPVRRALGVRTVFNQLGPLANPAGAQRQLIGVCDASMLQPMAEALALLGSEHAYVVRGQDDLDEVSPCAPTDFFEVRHGEIASGTFEPSDFGLENLDVSALEPGESAAENAAIIRDALGGGAPRSTALVPNAALALVLAGAAPDPRSGAELAWETLRSGKALKKLEDLVAASG